MSSSRPNAVGRLLCHKRLHCPSRRPPSFPLYRLTRLGVSPEGAKRCQLNFRSNAIGVPTLVNETRLIARSEMGQLAQAAAQIEMMPDLGGNDAAKP